MAILSPAGWTLCRSPPPGEENALQSVLPQNCSQPPVPCGPWVALREDFLSHHVLGHIDGAEQLSSLWGPDAVLSRERSQTLLVQTGSSFDSVTIFRT